MSKTQFQGFDWTELCEPLTGRPYEEIMEAHEDVTDGEAAVADAIRDAMYSEDEAERSRVAGLCRAFVSECAKGGHHDAPLWNGLVAIQDDETFLIYASMLLQCIWN
jgi:hypothetical protein